jgi:antirestriction protein ArdC
MKKNHPAEFSGKAQKQQDVFTRITEIILDRIASGNVAPWVKPWGIADVPRNYVTRRAYHGINFMMLVNAYEVPYYLTFNQIKELGGYVRKGERSLPIVFWKRILRDKNSNTDVTAEEFNSLPEDARSTSAILKCYNVFNIAQIEGIDFKLPEQPARETEDKDMFVKCSLTVALMHNRPRIQNGHAACYIPVFDLIKMPKQETFISDRHYYATLFHELVHATGSASRLNRSEVVKPSTFGSERYAREELVAELGSAFLCNLNGIANGELLDQSAAYLGGWARRLKDDPSLFIEATGKAYKAVAYIFGEQRLEMMLQEQAEQQSEE